MKKYIGTLALILSLAMAGCGGSAAKTEKEDKSAAEATAAAEKEEKSEEQKSDAEAQEEAGGEDNKTETDSAIAAELAAKKSGKTAPVDVIAEMTGWTYEFTSGAGAWQTSLEVREDGTFIGEYYDADMGITGEGYEENGTLTLANFTGKFGAPKERGPFIYEVPIEEINYAQEPGAEKIEDGTRYVYSEAYGLAGDDHVVVYLPGTPLEKLDQGYMDWITTLHFREWVNEKSYLDLPEDLPFCGIYQEKDQLGFFSSAREGRNRQYLVNRVGLPGLENDLAELNEDGTYHYRDMDRYGMLMVDSYCFETSPTDLEGDSEDIARAAVGRTDEGETMHDFYAMDAQSMEYMADVICMNGLVTRYAFWENGTNEDLRECSARILIDGDYTYVYIISVDADDEIYRAEAVHFYLSSLEISGSPEKLSSASPYNASRQILGYVKPGKEKDTLLCDELVWISGGDAQTLAEYGIDPDDVTNDYALGGDDGDYREYRVRDSIPCYAQNPYTEQIHGFMTLEEMREYVADEKLIQLILDDEDQVTFIYEPYTP